MVAGHQHNMDVIDTSLRVGVGMAGGGAGLPGGPGGGMGSREKLNPKQHCGFDEEQVAAHFKYKSRIWSFAWKRPF